MAGVSILRSDIAETNNEVALSCHGECPLSCRRVAGSANCADDCVLVSKNLNVGEREVSCLDALADSQAGNAYGYIVREIVHQSADTQ